MNKLVQICRSCKETIVAMLVIISILIFTIGIYSKWCDIWYQFGWNLFLSKQ